MPEFSEQLRAIKQAADIVQLVGDYVHLERAGNKFKGLCLFHEDHKPSMLVDPEFQSFKCWACQTEARPAK